MDTVIPATCKWSISGHVKFKILSKSMSVSEICLPYILLWWIKFWAFLFFPRTIWVRHTGTVSIFNFTQPYVWKLFNEASININKPGIVSQQQIWPPCSTLQQVKNLEPLIWALCFEVIIELWPRPSQLWVKLKTFIHSQTCFTTIRCDF